MVIQKNPEIIRQNFGVQLVHVMKFLSCCKLFFPRNGKIILLTHSNNNEQIVIGLANQKIISGKDENHSRKYFQSDALECQILG